MQVSMTVRAAGDGIVDGVRPALGQRAHMVYLQIRFTIVALKRGVLTATAIWLQTMVSLMAGDTVELQGYGRQPQKKQPAKERFVFSAYALTPRWSPAYIHHNAFLAMGEKRIYFSRSGR